MDKEKLQSIELSDEELTKVSGGSYTVYTAYHCLECDYVWLSSVFTTQSNPTGTGNDWLLSTSSQTCPNCHKNKCNKYSLVGETAFDIFCEQHPLSVPLK